MEGFEVTKIGKHIFCILDAGNSSFYMVEGDKKAAVKQAGFLPKPLSCRVLSSYSIHKEYVV